MTTYITLKTPRVKNPDPVVRITPAMTMAQYAELENQALHDYTECDIGDHIDKPIKQKNTTRKNLRRYPEREARAELFATHLTDAPQTIAELCNKTGVSPQAGKGAMLVLKNLQRAKNGLAVRVKHGWVDTWVKNNC